MLRLALSAVLGAAAVSAQSESSAAESIDPTTECKAYGFAPVSAMQKNYPTIWATGTIPSSDTEALALFAALNASIPNIAPRGTRDGDFTGVKYDQNADPDCWWTETKCMSPKISALPDDIKECPTANTYGLTYDDGPNCSHNAFYDFMQEKKLKATLFYIGSNVLDWPLEAQRGLADGHEICAHTWSHPYMTSMTNEEAFAELYYSKKAIKDVVGVTVQCWRPPFGDVDDRVRYIADALGMQTVVWVEDTFDWDYAALGTSTIEANYEGIIAMGKNGTWKDNGPIVLSHEIDNTTMDFAVKYLPDIVSAYSQVVPVAVCHNQQKPYVEQDIQYPNFSEWVAGTRTLSLATPTATEVGLSGMPLSSNAKGSVLPKLAYDNPAAATGGSSSSSSGSSGDSGSSNSSSSSDPSTSDDTSPDSSAARLALGFGRGEVLGMAATAAGVMAGWGWVASLL